MKSLTRLRWPLVVALLSFLFQFGPSASAQTTASTTAPTIAPVVPHGTVMERLQSAVGLVVFTLIGFSIGRLRGFRGGVPLRTILWGIALQFAFGAIVLFAPNVLEVVQLAIQKLLDFSNAGAELVFGQPLVHGIASVTTDQAGKGTIAGWAHLGFVFAVSVLPTILFISMLTAVLYHLGILTWVVYGLAWLMQKTMRTSGAETLSTAANIFVGQTEAPLIIRPFLPNCTRSELMAIMVGGFANIATGVLVVYTDLLKDYVPNAGGHLALACFISAPATLVVSKLMMPETDAPETSGAVKVKVERVDANLFDAATRGTSEGLALALNVGAMLITFTALVAMLNAISLRATGHTIEQMLGWCFSPLAWLTGIEWHDSAKVGSLLGVKTVLNEFLAYFEMNRQLQGDAHYLSPRAALLATYALCGFANFASVGIQIGGISVLAPARRHDLSRLGLLAMVGGAIATLMGACVVGILW
jgi:CNT family concentrative nucleoside transporter